MKTKTNTIIIVVLTILLLGTISYIGYDILLAKGKNNISNDKTNTSNKTGEEKELDINSRLVQSLYHKVTSDSGIDPYVFWRYRSSDNSNSLTDFNANSTSEEIKMQLVSLNLKDEEKIYINCSTTNIPAENAGYNSFCYLNKTYNDNSPQYAYTKSYIESVYKDLYGSQSKLDTSAVIWLDAFGCSKLVYVNTLDMYIEYTTECGGTSGPGGYEAKISKAIQKDDTIQIYQDVTETDYEEINGVIDESNEATRKTKNYTLIYTFKLDEDGMYNFISRQMKN